MKNLKLLICLTLGMLYSGSVLEAAKANFNRIKPNMKMDCKKLKGEAKQKCVAAEEAMKKSSNAIDHNASRSNTTRSSDYHDGEDLMLRKKPGRKQINTNNDCDDKKKKCKKP